MKVDSKSAIRRELKSLYKQPETEVQEAVKKRILSWEIFQKSRSVALYLSMKDEVDISFIIGTKSSCFLPRYNCRTETYDMAEVKSQSDLVAGKYGIKEPSGSSRKAAKNEIELWFIPGMAFDKEGNRLGRGAGFYDRLLDGEFGMKTGVCTAERVLDKVPVDDHDIKMDFVLTDTEIININL